MNVKSMRITCQVLLAIADAGCELTKVEIMDRLSELSTTQVEGALAALLKKRKVLRVYNRNRPDGQFVFADGSHGYRYVYNLEDPLPAVVGKPGGCSPARTTIRQVAAHCAASANDTSVPSSLLQKLPSSLPNLYRQKCEVLDRLIARSGGNDKDILIAIRGDYRALMARKSA